MVLQASPSAAAAVNVPAIFDPKRSQPLRRPQATWKATKQREQPESAHSTPKSLQSPRQNGYVRPVSYEEPISPKQTRQVSHTTIVADVVVNPYKNRGGKVPPTAQPQNGLLTTTSRSIPLTANTLDQSQQAVNRTAIGPRATQPAMKQQKQDAVRSANIETKNIPASEFKSLRNPMRSLKTQHEAVSEDNPLRERKSLFPADQAGTQSNLSNPLR